MSAAMEASGSGSMSGAGLGHGLDIGAGEPSANGHSGGAPFDLLPAWEAHGEAPEASSHGETSASLSHSFGNIALFEGSAGAARDSSGL